MALPRSEVLRRALLACAIFVLCLPSLASAQMLGADEAETLVRTRWFEALPEDDAKRIGPAGAARLMELLEDPSEGRLHANTLIALGLWSGPGALDAIAAWADTPRSGEVDRATFSAWQALPFALGHVAQSDPRAVARLETQLDSAPSWHFRHHRGARLVELGRRAAATCLALTGLPTARAALDRAAANTTDAGFAEHLTRARALHQQRAQELGR